MLQLYQVLICPHLEKSKQFGLPGNRNDVVAVERVQKRLTRMYVAWYGDIGKDGFSLTGIWEAEG